MLPWDYLIESAPLKLSRSTRGADVAAQIGPAPTLDAFYPFGGADYLATREEAMSVPAIARARNMICNSIATIPLITRDKDNRSSH
jgi:phage portal protein BeeE